MIAMKVERGELKERLKGECVAGVSLTDSETFLTPVHAVNSLEVVNGQRIHKKYGVNVVYPNEVLDVKWFWTGKDFDNLRIGSNAYDAHIDYINEMIKESHAKVFLYTPTFSSKIKDEMRKIELTKRISEESMVSAITLKEGVSPFSTRKVIEKEKAYVKQEKIDKDILLSVKADQDEDVFKANTELAAFNLNGVIWEYCSPKMRPENFVAMTDYANRKNFLRVLTNVARTYPRRGRAAVSSNMFFFSDIYSIARPFGFRDDEDEEGKQKRLTEEQRRENGMPNAQQYIENLDAYLTRSDFKAKGITKRKCCPLHERVDNNVDEFYMEFNERLYDAALACSVYGLYNRSVEVRNALLSMKLKDLLKKVDDKKVIRDLIKVDLGTQKSFV
jgi:hypothetical protein